MRGLGVVGMRSNPECDPVSERLKIDLTSFTDASRIEIINNNGQIVFTELLSGQTMVNISVGVNA